MQMVLLLDCHLTWHDHIDYICGKISKNRKVVSNRKATKQSGS